MPPKTHHGPKSHHGGDKLRASHIVGTCSTTESLPSSQEVSVGLKTVHYSTLFLSQGLTVANCISSLGVGLEVCTRFNLILRMAD